MNKHITPSKGILKYLNLILFLLLLIFQSGIAQTFNEIYPTNGDVEGQKVIKNPNVHIPKVLTPL